MRGGVAGQGLRGGLAGIDQDPPDGSIGNADLDDVVTAATKGGAGKLIRSVQYNSKGRIVAAAGEALNCIDYVGPERTADAASGNTLTLPETGLIVPVTGATAIHFITKPTGDAPRLVILLITGAGFQIRHLASSPPAGTTNIHMIQSTATSPLDFNFTVNNTLILIYDGALWRRVGGFAHWNNTGIQGSVGNAILQLNATTGTRLEYTTTTMILVDGAVCTITAPITRMTSKLRLVQGSVAVAANIVFPANCSSVLITGSAGTINTFTATGLEEGTIYMVEFDGANTITNNSGGANDWLSKDGANITTAAGMVLPFFFNGTDLVEVGR